MRFIKAQIVTIEYRNRFEKSEPVSAANMKSYLRCWNSYMQISVSKRDWLKELIVDSGFLSDRDEKTEWEGRKRRGGKRC